MGWSNDDYRDFEEPGYKKDPGGAYEIPPFAAGGPRVRFGVIGEAWGLLMARLGTWITVMVLFLVCYFLVYKLASVVVGPVYELQFKNGLRILNPKSTVSSRLVHGVVAAVVNGCFLGALFRLACKQVRGERFGAMDLLGVSDVLPALATGALLYWAGCSVGFMMCFFPGLVFSSLWMLSWPLIVDARVPAWQALGMSWRMLSRQWFEVTVFHMVLGLILGLGVAFCFVGALLTGPIYVLSIARIYQDFTGAKPAVVTYV